MKILLTGGAGLLGSSLRRRIEKTRHELWAPSHGEMDITDERSVKACFASLRPDAVIHCAAYSNVDRAESEETACRALNVGGTAKLAAECGTYGCYMLYLSTDYVFDGKKQGWYETHDPKHPLSVYGRSKSDGEDIVLSGERACVLRTSWLFGRTGRSFPASILRICAERGTIRVVNDQIGSPTWADDLSETILSVCEQRIPGVLHATGEGECSWAEFARAILKKAGSQCVVEPITSEEYPSAAKRPGNSRLSKASLDAAGLKRLPSWESGLDGYLSTL